MTDPQPQATRRREIPEWFDQAKFGIMIAWTPAAVPGFAPPKRPDRTDDENFERFFRENPCAEMYWNTMQIPGSPTKAFHEEHFAGRTYEDFVEEFKKYLKRWDPEHWVDLIERAGAKYVVLCAKLEDGFALWPSSVKNPKVDNWFSERDIVGELAEAVRARGIRFGILFSGGMDFTFGGMPITDLASLRAAHPDTPEFVEYSVGQYRELIEKYRPEVLWDDWGYPPSGDPHGLIEWYWEQVPEGIANNRFAGYKSPEIRTMGDINTPEYAVDYAGYSTVKERKWEGCRGIGASWGYNRAETEDTYTSASQLIREFTEILARGGNFLLNIGPTATGEIPWEQAERLLAIGHWIRTNELAVYNAREWDVSASFTGEGQRVYYSQDGDALYAMVLPDEPHSLGRTTLGLELKDSVTVQVLGSEGTVSWEADGSGAAIDLGVAPTSPAVVLRLAPIDAIRPSADWNDSGDSSAESEGLI